MAAQVKDVLGDSGVKISTVGIFGNPLETTALDQETLRGWETLIDHAHLFGADIVSGFTGRLRDQPLDASLPRYKEVFGELGKRAADKGVRIAFENCWMGGDWQRGDWNIAHSPDAWSKMFDVLPLDNIGLEWEPCHQMVALIDPMPQLNEWVPKIFHVHGKDGRSCGTSSRSTASAAKFPTLITGRPASGTATGPTSSACCACTGTRAALTSKAGTTRSTRATWR